MAFELTNQRERAALLLARDEKTDEEIGKTVGVCRRTIANWKKEQDFAVRVAEHVAVMAQEMRKLPLAKRIVRVRHINDRWERLNRVMRARSRSVKDTRARVEAALGRSGSDLTPDDQRLLLADEEYPAPGAEEGVMTRTRRSMGKGADFQVIVDWAIDTGLLTQLLNHEERAARELGQLVARSTLAPTDANGDPLGPGRAATATMLGAAALGARAVVNAVLERALADLRAGQVTPTVPANE